jgi:Putative DNA-binding domain
MSKMHKTTALLQQQRDLLNAIFTTNTIASQAINTPARVINGTTNRGFNRGLQAYQANADASAQRSLQAAYPVIAQLIGEVAFEHLARDFWAQQPPTRGDLAQWGGELSGFIANIPALQTEPYLSDVAKAEWALHTTATAADIAADMATFSLLTTQNPDTLTLQFAPGTSLIFSSYPIASILSAHLYASPSFAEVGQKLRQNVGETALVWRQGLRPMVALCPESDAQLLTQLLSGKSLLAALESKEHTVSDSPFDFQGWLPHAVTSGLLLGVRPI